MAIPLTEFTICDRRELLLKAFAEVLQSLIELAKQCFKCIPIEAGRRIEALTRLDERLLDLGDLGFGAGYLVVFILGVSDFYFEALADRPPLLNIAFERADSFDQVLTLE